MTATSDNDGHDVTDTRLVIHLYRQYELPVAYAADTGRLSGAMQGALMMQIQESQADFVSRLGQLRHNYSNYVRRITGSDTRVNHRGIYQDSVGWYQSHRPEIYECFKQLLLDIRNLLPSLPPSRLDGVDPAIADRLRRFDTESEAVIVQPVRDMALKVLTHSLVGEGMLTEQAMLVYFDLRDDDFTRPGFSKVIARVIHDRQRLFFRQRIPDALLAGNINVLQGQLDGHCSHLLSLLTSRDMSEYVQTTLSSIRQRHLPIIMTRVIDELAALDGHRPQPDSPSHLRNRVLETLVIHPGPLAAGLTTLTEWDPENDSLDPAEPLRHVVGGLRSIARRAGGVPVDDLPALVKAVQATVDASLGTCLALLQAYVHVIDRVEGAVGPLLGLISFDTGGQSQFYARWFPGLNGLLERDGRIEEYISGMERLRDQLRQVGAHARGRRTTTAAWLDSATWGRVTGEPPQGDTHDEAVQLIAFVLCLLQALAEAPVWMHELEEKIFAAVDGKKNEAQRVLAASRKTGG